MKPEARRATLAEAAIFVPAPGGSARLLLEAGSCGCAIADPAGLADQPELAAAAVARLAEDDGLRAARATKAARPRQSATSTRLAERARARVRARRRPAAPAGAPAHPDGDPLGDRDWIVVDLHMHTHRSHDCSIEPQALIDHAEAEGLGAIAVTDHNVFAAPTKRSSSPSGRDLIVIPGEEVKTDNQGEVIGLFLQRRFRAG